MLVLSLLHHPLQLLSYSKKAGFAHCVTLRVFMLFGLVGCVDDGTRNAKTARPRPGRQTRPDREKPPSHREDPLPIYTYTALTLGAFRCIIIIRILYTLITLNSHLIVLLALSCCTCLRRLRVLFNNWSRSSTPRPGTCCAKRLEERPGRAVAKVSGEDHTHSVRDRRETADSFRHHINLLRL